MTTLLEALLKVKADLNDYVGLCDNVIEQGGDDHAFKLLCEQWPKYSGNSCFPVPSVSAAVSAAFYYRIASTNGTLYKGEYGALRLELLDWCIEELSK